MLGAGAKFDRYTIEATIGQGGMGTVYRAFDPRLGRRIAIKLISCDTASEEARARLVREARAVAALDHPGAVGVFDVGEHEGVPFIVMELVEGRTLRAMVTDASVPLATRVDVLTDVARALGAAHGRGLVHRDVKPENVMVRPDGAVKVLDFGIARRAHGGDVDPTGKTQTPALSTLTLDGAKLGTPVYMAPEQIKGDPLDGRTDQFAWGVVAYELLAGRLPWRGGDDALAVMASILTDAAPPEPLAAAGVSPALRAVVLRALSKRPEERFGSMEDVVAALAAAARGEAPSAGEATSAQRFGTDEVRAVLSRAVERQAQKPSGRLGFADLLEVAKEVGVDEDSLRDASRALRTHAEDALGASRDRAAWLRRQRRAFYRHAGVYLVVNGALAAFGFALASFLPLWLFLLPSLGWGIGLAIHGVVTLTTNEDDWDARQRHKQSRRGAREGRLERRGAAEAHGRDGARAGVDAEPEGRRRIEAAPRPRIRVARSERDTEETAEDEAERAARPAAARRR